MSGGRRRSGTGHTSPTRPRRCSARRFWRPGGQRRSSRIIHITRMRPATTSVTDDHPAIKSDSGADRIYAHVIRPLPTSIFPVLSFVVFMATPDARWERTPHFLGVFTNRTYSDVTALIGASIHEPRHDILPPPPAALLPMPTGEPNPAPVLERQQKRNTSRLRGVQVPFEFAPDDALVFLCH